MRYVKAYTPPQAPLGRRAMAYLIDLLVVSGLIQGLMIQELTADWPFNGYLVLSYVIIALYYTGMTYFFQGQTLGKMVFQIRVTRYDLKAPSFQDIFLRESVGRIIQDAYVFLYFVPLFNRDRLTGADWLAGTVVIDDRLIFEEEIYEVEDDVTKEVASVDGTPSTSEAVVVMDGIIREEEMDNIPEVEEDGASESPEETNN